MRTLKASNRRVGPSANDGSDGYHFFIALIAIVVVSTMAIILGIGLAMIR
ncbi:hypothetical protein [Hyphomicrobium methylovorum]|nr:hypothetical protein [Hyphomicrobium methylovorum]